MSLATTAHAALTREEELYWLALKMTPGLGTRRSVQLVERFGGPEAVFRASRAELEGCGLSGSVAQSIASGCAFDDAVEQQQKTMACGAMLIPFQDARYPARLREIFDPPLVLFARGRVELLDSVMLGIVGTRRPTSYGTAAAERLAADLAQAGLTISSGMARGIDTAAHKAVLAVKGNTIAVFGCGVDVLYPAENRALKEEIAEKGLLLSEYPMGTPAYPQNFPVRNRIISGMSAGVLIVEGAQYSGSAITARMALEQQREVFAVPGSIMSKMSWGPNLLIKQGAKLVQDWNDVITELPAGLRQQLSGQAQQRLFGDGAGESSRAAAEDSEAADLSPVHRELLKLLKPDVSMHLDEVLATLERYSSSELIAAVFDLELIGLVRQLPGKNFVRVW